MTFAAIDWTAHLRPVRVTDLPQEPLDQDDIDRIVLNALGGSWCRNLVEIYSVQDEELPFTWAFDPSDWQERRVLMRRSVFQLLDTQVHFDAWMTRLERGRRQRSAA